MAIDKNYIEQLKSKNEIVDVIGAYCQLEKRGGAYWARCPLPGHMEKTPSFCVNQAGQFFKCFGCGRGGDVITFIMEVESLNYVEAVKFLASRAGMPPPDTDAVDDKRAEEARKRKETYLSILLEAAKFYRDNLYSDGGKAYLDYMLGRGFTMKTLRVFGIGASLDYRSLPKHLHGLGFSYDDMAACGVVSFNKATDEYVDFEAKRLIVPIIDNMGNVIAFGGRVIEKTDFAKYKNTRETSVFIKNKCLYNVNNLKDLKRKQGDLPYVIMVEGYMDVIALVEAGFKNVVASMGTSLTIEQARLLKRYTDTAVISYDGDAAGQHATFRGLQILKDVGVEVKVISLPDGLDPDELIKLRGREAYFDLIEGALPLIDYKLKVLGDKFDVRTIDGKRKYVENALRVIAETDKEFEREELLKKISEKSRITYESLKRDLEKAPEKKSAPKVTAVYEASSAIVKAEQFVLYAHILSKPYANGDVASVEYSDAKRTDIAEYLRSVTDTGKEVVPSSLAGILGNDYIDELNAIFLLGDGVPAEVAEKYYSDCRRLLAVTAIEGQLNDLKEYFSTLTDIDERKTILERIQYLIGKLNSLKTEDKL